MAIDQTFPTRLRIREHVLLAGLFDDAWQHGRKRLSRYIAVLALVLAAGVVVLITQLGGPRPSPVTTRVASGTRYEVCASELKYLWRYTYGTGCASTRSASEPTYSYHTLVLPAGSRVQLTVAAPVTAQTLRIPGLGLTLRLGPHVTTRTSFRTPRARASYTAECLGACGRHRLFASTNVTIVPPNQYKRWLANQAAVIKRQDTQAGQIRNLLMQEGLFAPNAPR